MSQESPTELPAVTLNYATAEPRRGLRLFAGITLVLWSIFDLASALFLFLYAAFMANYGGSQPFAALFLVLGIVVAVFSVLAMYCGVSVLKKMRGAVAAARDITTVGEILCWLAALVTLAVTYYNDRLLARTLTEFWFVFAVVCLAIPGAVSITRIILGRLAKAELPA